VKEMNIVQTDEIRKTPIEANQFRLHYFSVTTVDRQLDFHAIGIDIIMS
jgi:hypothetical protein